MRFRKAGSLLLALGVYAIIAAVGFILRGVPGFVVALGIVVVIEARLARRRELTTYARNWRR